LASRFYDDNPVKFTQPALQYVVNFDERLFVYRAYNTAQIKLNVEPARRYIPSHWTCYQDDTYKYIPAELSKQWLLAELK
jgi:hypothetical protein